MEMEAGGAPGLDSQTASKAFSFSCSAMRDPLQDRWQQPSQIATGIGVVLKVNALISLTGFLDVCHSEVNYQRDPHS